MHWCDGLRFALTLSGSVWFGRGRLKRRMRRRVRFFRWRPAGLVGLVGRLVLAIEHFQVSVVVVVARLCLFPQRFVIFLAFEHFLGHFYGGMDVVACGGGTAAAAAVVVIVVGVGVSGGTGDGDRSCVLYLSDGVLDEP